MVPARRDGNGYAGAGAAERPVIVRGRAGVIWVKRRTVVVPIMAVVIDVMAVVVMAVGRIRRRRHGQRDRDRQSEKQFVGNFHFLIIMVTLVD